MTQIVNLESSGDITFRSKYKLIWSKRNTEIIHENEKVKSYNRESIKENINLLMM